MIIHHAMSTFAERAGVVPAALSFLAIYNPSLSSSDENVEDQIVYYYSRAYNDRKIACQSHGAQSVEITETREDKDEKLRHVGLAQGMVDFAK